MSPSFHLHEPLFYFESYKSISVKFKNDSRVQFLKVWFFSPILKKNTVDLWLLRADNGKKIKFATDYAIEIGASFVMTLDSDDCISNRICEFVSKNNDSSILGWYVKKEYLYREGKTYAFLNSKNFNTLCGSSVIIKPELIDLMYSKDFWFKHERISFKNDLLLLPIPFPGSLYSLVNGTNIALDNKEMKKRTTYNPTKLASMKTLFRRLVKYVVIPKLFIKNKFSLYKLSQGTTSCDVNG
jgi:hypothetical protein